MLSHASNSLKHPNELLFPLLSEECGFSLCDQTSKRTGINTNCIAFKRERFNEGRPATTEYISHSISDARKLLNESIRNLGYKLCGIRMQGKRPA